MDHLTADGYLVITPERQAELDEDERIESEYSAWLNEQERQAWERADYLDSLSQPE